MSYRWGLLFFVGCLLHSWIGLAAGPEDFHGEWPNAVALEEGLVGGGSPSEKAIQLAAGKGYKTIIDLRLPEEGIESEKTLVGRCGMRYVNIPTSAESLGREQADQLNHVLSEEAAKPAILHCASGNRAAAVWAVYRRFHQGETSDRSLSAAEVRGLKPNLKEKLVGIFAAEDERGGVGFLGSGQRDLKMKITSPAFKEGDRIPEKYTCDGQDISPPLVWSEIPAATATLALIMDDPDARGGAWAHWVLYNLPAHFSGLPEQRAPEKKSADGAEQGKNDFRKIGYGGPCPPGGTHRYYLKLYALNTSLNLAAGATKSELLSVMKDHVLAEAFLMGTYSRHKQAHKSV